MYSVRRADGSFAVWSCEPPQWPEQPISDLISSAGAFYIVQNCVPVDPFTGDF